MRARGLLKQLALRDAPLALRDSAFQTVPVAMATAAAGVMIGIILQTGMAIGGQGGVVNQMLGDGLMAIFGAPLPHADHRTRAARAALEMLDLVEGFNREQELRGGVEIRIGIGIASGPVVAGFTGTQHRVTYTCVGDTVNLASHLEAHTKIVRPAGADRRES